MTNTRFLSDNTRLYSSFPAVPLHRFYKGQTENTIKVPRPLGTSLRGQADQCQLTTEDNQGAKRPTVGPYSNGDNQGPERLTAGPYSNWHIFIL